MNYPGLPFGMWLLFHRSFRKKLISVLGFSPLVAAETKKKARAEYRAIIARLPEYEKGDQSSALVCTLHLTNRTRDPER